MSGDKALSWTFTEEYAAEDAAITQARYRSEELGVSCVSAGTGAALRLLAGALGAKAVLEIGTGVGVSALWTLSGMAADGVLTSIDCEAEFHKEARRSFQEANLPTNRTRLITGRALDVLPRMAGRAYDMVIIDADVPSVPTYVAQAGRVLRPGGIVAIVHALWHDQVCDPARREEDVVTMRQVLTEISEGAHFLPTLLNCGDGLLAAVRL